MFDDYIKRENIIFYILNDFNDAGLFFIIVGGYGVSAYKHRFSVDADIIIREEDLTKFEDILKKKKFVKSISRELDHAYTGLFVSYQKKNGLAASVDLLVGGIGSRTTNASFSIEQIKENSKKRKIIGTEKEILAYVADPEILIILKLHSGRLTDFRDVAALCKNIDLNLIKKYIWRGNENIVKNNILKLLELINKREFMDSFKGVFIEKKYSIDIESINKLKELL